MFGKIGTEKQYGRRTVYGNTRALHRINHSVFFSLFVLLLCTIFFPAHVFGDLPSKPKRLAEPHVFLSDP